jgi:hypothetical protein
MTLDTRVYVLDRVDYRETFITCAKLIGVTELAMCRGDDVDYQPIGGTVGPRLIARYEDEQDKTWHKGERFVEPGNPWTMMTVPGQGLAAWLMLHYRQDAPLRTSAEAEAHDEDCNLPGSEYYDPEADLCDGSWHRTACWLEISFDTAYSYRDEQGRGCGDLHASLIADLGRWLDERGVRWSWKNEFTGDVHTGYDRLIELCSGGFEASAWFRTSVLPAIEQEIGGAS